MDLFKSAQTCVALARSALRLSSALSFDPARLSFLRPHGSVNPCIPEALPPGGTCWFSSSLQSRPSSTSSAVVRLSNLRDNDDARKKRIRVGRGNSSRRGNYCGRGMNGQKARSGAGPHLLYDGGQLGLLKFPVTRERPPYEVLYTQVGLSKLIEYIQLGLLRADRVITMKDLQDVGCASGIKYGVLLYGKAPVHFPIHIQVSACDDATRASIQAGGGSVTRVYYEEEGLRALLHPGVYKRKKLPLPLPAISWHPRFNGKFDAIGQLMPSTAVQLQVEA